MTIDTRPIIIGSYRLPPSINDMYANNFKHGRGKVLSVEARDFKKDLNDHMSSPDERYFFYADEVALRMVREWGITLLKKQLKSHQKPMYELDILFVFADDRRDVDGGHKIMQDVITKWLGINDTRIWRVRNDKTIQAGNPHVEFVVRPLAEAMQSGSLIDEALAELQPQTYDPDFYIMDTCAS